MSSGESNELRYFRALRRIAKDRMTINQLRRDHDKGFSGALSYEEFVEMAYENMQDDARIAIKGKRRPKA